MIVFSPQYFAGVLDSDGSFSISKRHLKRIKCNYTCMIGLTWTKTDKVKEFMDFICLHYGGSYALCLPSNTGNFKNSKPVLKYCATGVAAEKIITDVMPYLVLKKIQAENLLKVRTIVKGIFGNGVKRTEDETKSLDDLYILNKSLNSKNGKGYDTISL
jgi:hypothetical protein